MEIEAAAEPRGLARADTFRRSQVDWLIECFEGLTTELWSIKPSEWAEQKRYLPPQVTPLPGPFRFDVAPYTREIVDCMSDDSPVREVAWKKGAQIAATVAVLENAIGYYIEHDKKSPLMLVTADADLALLRMESYIVPMLRFSELDHLIKSSDEKNRRKTGQTQKRIEWVGGGFLIPFGAQNANKFRSMSVRVLLGDEVDAWPLVVGKDGDPVELVKSRTNAYEASRKLLWLSTPKIKGQSKIDALYRRGDQRQYFVRCLGCQHPQVLRWSHTDKETGVVSGIVWQTDADGTRVVPGSVRYLCQQCGRPHTDDEKAKLLSPEYGAEWRPTAVPISPDVRSYHLSALYSPVGMQSWESCVKLWLEAMDPETGRARDYEKLQVFYNNILGEVYELRGEWVLFQNVSAHRRQFYRFGEIPNKALEVVCGGPVLLLTAAVDVHSDCLKVSVQGWCRDRRAVLIDYWTFTGDTEQVDDPATWGKLRALIEEREYVADDDKRYRVRMTLIDSGYRTDTVYRFCADYEGGVFPVKGQTTPPKSARVREYAEFKTETGGRAFGITVDLYKDRWAASLRRGWEGEGVQPAGSFNAPQDITDKQLKELTAEVKREVKDKDTQKLIGVVWHRTSAVPNELWDLLVYNNAALDLLARGWMEIAELEYLDWAAFWEDCATGLHFT